MIMYNFLPTYMHIPAGCFCPEGTVEFSIGCIAPENCPSSKNNTAIQECPEGMTYRTCGSACPVTCDNKDDNIGCLQVCVPGEYIVAAKQSN